MRLNGRTESDFLAIGGKLGEFAAAARQLSADLSALSELVRGEECRQACGALMQSLERLQGVGAQVEGCERELADIRGAAERVRRGFGGFRHNAAVFRALGSMTRIEAARLGDAGSEFGDVAEEAGGLSETMESGARSVIEASAELDTRVRAALAAVSTLRREELKGLPRAVAEVLESVRALEDRQGRASEASLREAADYREISGAIADLVNALQFHDITRQQVEHAAEALRGLARGWRASGRRGGPADGAVLGLQCSQLDGAARTFADSAGRIERSLETLGARLQGMAERAQNLLGLSAGDEDSFFLEMEGRFTVVLKSLERAARVEEETRGVAEGLAESARQMRESARGIAELGIKIHRIALNAAVRAVQIGGSGDALAVIAEAMQRLARDAEGAIGSASEDIEAISAAVTRLSGGLRIVETGPAADGAADACVEMRASILRLHSASEISFLWKRTAETGARLSAAVRTARDGFAAGELFAGEIEAARQALERLGAERAATAETPGILAGYTGRYTMQAEREVHRSALGGPEPDRTAAAVPQAANLGENVELF